MKSRSSLLVTFALLSAGVHANPWDFEAYGVIRDFTGLGTSMRSFINEAPPAVGEVKLASDVANPSDFQLTTNLVGSIYGPQQVSTSATFADKEINLNLSTFGGGPVEASNSVGVRIFAFRDLEVEAVYMGTTVTNTFSALVSDNGGILASDFAQNPGKTFKTTVKAGTFLRTDLINSGDMQTNSGNLKLKIDYAPVPELASMAVIGIGLAGLARKRKVRRS